MLARYMQKYANSLYQNLFNTDGVYILYCNLRYDFGKEKWNKKLFYF
jgi:hypothetical protein